MSSFLSNIHNENKTPSSKEYIFSAVAVQRARAPSGQAHSNDAWRDVGQIQVKAIFLEADLLLTHQSPDEV
jgi:hypothetical protein